jgi:hypothetical protein
VARIRPVIFVKLPCSRASINQLFMGTNKCKKNTALGMRCIPRGIRTGDPWYIHNKVGVGKLVDSPDLARQMDILINFSSFANCPSAPPEDTFREQHVLENTAFEYVVCR